MNLIVIQIVSLTLVILALFNSLSKTFKLRRANEKYKEKLLNEKSKGKLLKEYNERSIKRKDIWGNIEKSIDKIYDNDNDKLKYTGELFRIANSLEKEERKMIIEVLENGSMKIQKKYNLMLEEEFNQLTILRKEQKKVLKKQDEVIEKLTKEAKRLERETERLDRKKERLIRKKERLDKKRGKLKK